MSFSLPKLDGYLNKTQHLITDQNPSYTYNGPELYHYKCMVDYIYLVLINTFPKKLHITTRIIYCQALADDIIDVLNTSIHNPYDDVFSFYIFDKVGLFDNDYWGNADKDYIVNEKIKQNYENLMVLWNLRMTLL